ncbi:PAS domain-containing protein [Aureococcus anophagefferens]|nr:PAS domain-containing protein [Aureococcus anophagefferens]
MGFWALRTLDAQRHGARCEVALAACTARFVGGGATAENPIKLLRLELAYDMQSFARTVEAAASAPLPYAPNSLYDATFHDDPRAKVVTTARRPFVIANVNQAWLDLCGFGKDEVLGRTMSCIQGELTDRRAVESARPVAAGRAADMTLINYTSKGDAFLNYAGSSPLRGREPEPAALQLPRHPRGPRWRRHATTTPPRAPRTRPLSPPLRCRRE